MFNSGAMVPVVANIGDCNGGGGNNNRGGLFGNNDDILALIILFAVFGGWGFGGYGGRNSGGGSSGESTTIVMPPSGGYGMSNSDFGFAEAAVQRGFDNQAVISKLDGITNGICNLGYDQLSQMNGINSNIQAANFGLQQAINNNTVAGMQNTNTLQNNITTCCCNLQSDIQNLLFQMSTMGCDIKSAVHQVGDTITQSQNWGFRNLQDTITAGFNDLARREDARYIRELEAKLNACDRDSALQATANYIINTTHPRPVPAYPSCNPNNAGNWSANVLSGAGFGGYNAYTNGCCGNGVA